MGNERYVREQMQIAEVRNLPRIGHTSNAGFFTTTQLNIAGVATNDNNSLEDSLGEAGKFHIDKGDHGWYRTCMINLSAQLDRTKFHPGFFFFPQLRVYLELDEFDAVTFCGLNYHGGSAPRAISPSVTEEERKAIVRLTMICYPNKDTIEGQLAMVLSGSTGNNATEINMNASRKSTSTLSFITHSKPVMSALDTQVYIQRGIVQHILQTVEMMPNDRRLHVDVPMLLRSISGVNSEGGLFELPGWDHGPGTEWHREHHDAWRAYMEEKHRQSEMLIPYCLRKADGPTKGQRPPGERIRIEKRKYYLYICSMVFV